MEGGTTLDDGCQIASHVLIKSGTSLGVNCVVAEGAVLGGRPQHLQAGNEVGRVDIGNHNVIREYVTINRARDIVKSCVLNFSGGVLQYSVNERFSFE